MSLTFHSLGQVEALEALGFGKHAASKLRSLFGLTEDVVSGGARRFRANVGGRHAGHLNVSPEGTISYSELLPEFQGMGLGKKMYGEVARRMPGQMLKSDAIMTPEAARVWESFKRSPSYKVTEGPRVRSSGGELRAAIPMQKEPLFQAKLPAASAVRPPRPKLRTQTRPMSMMPPPQLGAMGPATQLNAF